MVYFLSDAHIGSRALTDRRQHERRVCSLLKQLGNDAKEIYLLGDIFDFWYEYLWQKPEEYRLTLDTLRSLTDKGVKVHYFIGNHDIWTFGWLEKQTGVILHRQPQQMTICGKICLLAHGDGLIPSDMINRYPKEVRRKIRHFLFIRKVFHNPLLQHLFALLPPQLGNRFGYGWACRSRLREMENPVKYKGENNEELVLYAKEQERTHHRDYYIFGHRHIELTLTLSTSAQVVIVGDMFRQWTYARMNDNGQIELLNFESEQIK